MESPKMGNVILQFKPRDSLSEFAKGKTKVSLIRRISGRKSSKNMAIHGENLSALAALKAGFGAAGKSMTVDIIYIDPPYNVGGEQGYKNTWKGKSEKERHWAGDHGLFLDFMEPRLKIGRALLGPAGLMMVSICDGEYCRLKVLLDEVFGEDNHIGTFIWDKLQGSASRHFRAVHEYVLVYAKDATKAPPLAEEKPAARIMLDKVAELKDRADSYQTAQAEYRRWLGEKLKRGELSKGEAAYKFLHPVTMRPFASDNSNAHTSRESRCRTKLKHPVTNKNCPVPPNGWKWSEETLQKMYAHTTYDVGDGFVVAGGLVFGDDEANTPRKLNYLDEKMGHVVSSVINMSSAQAKDELPPGVEFTTPKPVSLIKYLLSKVANKNAVVLDYFAGSASTAQAVHELNKDDGGSRSWIMVEEMGSTFHEVLLKRLHYFGGDDNFATYEVQTATVGDKALLNVFKQYSYDFLSAYHHLDESASITAAGINIVGYDSSNAQVVAMTLPEQRRGKNYFEEELLALKQSIRASNAKSVLIYTLAQEDKSEEPWAGVDKSILSGTTCKNLQVVSIPSELVEEWSDVLTAIAS